MSPYSYTDGYGRRHSRRPSGQTILRDQRLAAFRAALAAAGYGDPADAPDDAVIKAGEQAGVGWPTARAYRAGFRQQRGDAS